MVPISLTVGLNAHIHLGLRGVRHGVGAELDVGANTS